MHLSARFGMIEQRVVGFSITSRVLSATPPHSTSSLERFNRPVGCTTRAVARYTSFGLTLFAAERMRKVGRANSISSKSVMVMKVNTIPAMSGRGRTNFVWGCLCSGGKKSFRCANLSLVSYLALSCNPHLHANAQSALPPVTVEAPTAPKKRISVPAVRDRTHDVPPI